MASWLMRSPPDRAVLAHGVVFLGKTLYSHSASLHPGGGYCVVVLGKTYGLLTKCEVKMVGYWPSSLFASLWTETQLRYINSQKKNED